MMNMAIFFQQYTHLVIRAFISKVITYLLFIGIGLFYKTVNAQSQLDWLWKRSDFKLLASHHLHEVNDVLRRGKVLSVSVALFRPNVDTMNVYLTSISHLSEAKEHLPASFTTIEGRPFLVYDGSELLIEDRQKWFSQVRDFIGVRLCNDLDYLEALKQPGPKELVVPCPFIYDASIEKLSFVAGKLIKRELVGRVPYYF